MVEGWPWEDESQSRLQGGEGYQGSVVVSTVEKLSWGRKQRLGAGQKAKASSGRGLHSRCGRGGEETVGDGGCSHSEPPHAATMGPPACHRRHHTPVSHPAAHTGERRPLPRLAPHLPRGPLSTDGVVASQVWPAWAWRRGGTEWGRGQLLPSPRGIVVLAFSPDSPTGSLAHSQILGALLCDMPSGQGSLAVQWLGLGASICRVWGSIPGQETKTLKAKLCVGQIKTNTSGQGEKKVQVGELAFGTTFTLGLGMTSHR